MRQGPPPNGRSRPRGRHHSGGGHGGPRHDGGNHGGGNPSMRTPSTDNRPRSAVSLRNQSFDSNCIDLRVRGNAWQVHEKYQALARDAQGSGDRVAAENYLQHAEHYFRIIEAINEATAVEQRASGRPPEGVPYNGQPEMPTNYYGAAGAPPVTASGAPQDPNGNVTPMGVTPMVQQQQQQHQPQQHAQAEVQLRHPPQPQQSPFFTPDEVDTDGPQSLVAQR